jgi:hypothetical protein
MTTQLVIYLLLDEFCANCSSGQCGNCKPHLVYYYSWELQGHNPPPNGTLEIVDFTGQK